MVNCPYCGRPAMSLLKKSSLGPGRVVKCQSCGKPIATHWIGILAAFPAFVGGFAMMKTESLPLGLAYVAAGILTMAMIQTFVVPLMKGDAK